MARDLNQEQERKDIREQAQKNIMRFLEGLDKAYPVYTNPNRGHGGSSKRTPGKTGRLSRGYSARSGPRAPYDL